MIYPLENEYMQFGLQPEQACWTLYSHQEGALALEGARMSADYRQGRTRFDGLERWELYRLSDPEPCISLYGPLRQLNLVIGPDVNNLVYTLSFALHSKKPFFLWRLSVENGGFQPVYIDRLTLLQVGAPRQAMLSGTQSRFVGYRSPILSPAFFSNGWGSWNYTGTYGMDDRFRRTRLGFLSAPLRVNAGTPQPSKRGHFASDMFGVLGDRANRVAFLAGFLSQQEHFGSLEAWLGTPHPALRLWANGDGARLDPGEHITTDWACLYFLDMDAPDPLGPYLEAVARQHGISQHDFSSGPYDVPATPASPLVATSDLQLGTSKFQPAASASPTGWCSWYQFFQEVTAQDVRRNLAAAVELRPDLSLDVIQIDDGFEASVGDWLSFSQSFPDGVATLADEIRASGFTPGLWLAPYIVERGSRLASEHPDWLLRGRLNRPVNAGFIWNNFTTALDLTHPEALAYTCQVVRTAVQEWGFPYLKLDFLYAAALPGRRHDPTCTRAQILRVGLERLREAAGEQTFLLGCGCPLGPAIGLVDAMRIGADVDVRWRPAYHGVETFFHAEPDYPSARNAIQNVLTRAPLHRRWWANDPDCLLLRPDTQLSLDEVHSLATVISLTDGLLFLSDDLSALPPDRLQIAQTLLPLIGKMPRILDWFDSATPHSLRVDLHNASGFWHILARFNWDDTPKDIILRLGDYDLEPGEIYLGREFWSGETYRITDGMLVLEGVPAHGVVLLTLRPYTPSLPQYLGSDLHISQGLEVSAWRWQEDELSLRLMRPGRAAGKVSLCLPTPPRSALLEGHHILWQSCGEDCYYFPVEFEQQAELRLSLLRAN